MKSLRVYLGVLMCGVFLLAGCNAPETESTDSDKLQVVATLFPQYDFVRQIAGDKVEVTKLLPPGVDVHSYEPTPSDIITLNQADLFIYTGEEMEPWAHRLVESVDSDITVLDVSTNVPLIPWGDASHDHDHEHAEDCDHEHGEDCDHEHHEDCDHEHHEDCDHEHHEDCDHEHHEDCDHEHHEDCDHEHDEDCDHEHDSDHSHSHSHSHGHDGCDHEYDPHIWTSPINAIIMVNNILEALIELDPENEAYYRANAEAYIQELEALDASFREVVENAKRDTIYHAGRFAVHYLMYEYGINFVAAPMETEPSVALVAQMITEIKEYSIPVIFHEELVNPQIAQMISDETGATMLLLHSLHNVSNDELESGITYLDLMKQNVENLRLGLS